MKEAPKKEVYMMEPAVERALAIMCCSNPRVFAAVGHAVEADRLRSPTARRLVEVSQAVAKKIGGGPTNPLVVVQHLNNLMSSGKATLEEIQDCKDLLLDFEEDFTADELVAVVAPAVQRVRHLEATRQALDGYKRNAPPEETAHLFDKVSKIGKSTASGSAMTLDQVIAGEDFFKGDDKKDKFLLGVQEIDDALEGVEKGSISLLVGGTGSGKSMALGHVAAEALLACHDVVYITLELSVTMVSRRIVRNLVDMTKREMMFAPDEVKRRVDLLKGDGLGDLMLHYCEPIETSPRDIRAVIQDYCREHPRFTPRVFVVDFVDKLRVNAKESMYTDMLAVMDGLRSMAVEADGWTWTAAQSNKQATNKPWPDVDAVADSMNKVRSADVVIGIGRTEEDKIADQIRFSIPKRREGEGANTRIGPIAWDPEHGRIAHVTRRFPW